MGNWTDKGNKAYNENTEKKENPVYAPYNFVPFSEKYQTPYKKESDLPRHDRFDPQKKTGEIHVTLTADTPVFVSDGNREDPHFFRGANGEFMIPGSTIRGLIRENMQILGFGLIRVGEDMEDYQIFFRKVAAANYTNDKDLQTYYKNVLEVKTLTKGERHFSVPQKVSAGYICREGNQYKIYPVKGTYLRVSRNNEGVKQFDQTEQDEHDNQRKNNAKAVRVHYAEGLGKIIIFDEEGEIPDYAKTGYLLYTGKAVKNQNGLYLFPEIDREADSEVLSEEDKLSYMEDWEKRKNSLEAYYDSEFWKLPDESDEPKPVFYVHHEGHIYCGMSLFLRIGYEYPLSHGLPSRSEEVYKQIDYPQAIFGFAKQETAYRSRVSVSDFPADKGAKEMGKVSMILGEPKPSYYPGYVAPVQKNGHSVATNYNAEKFKLRGYKQYWLKNDIQETDPGNKKKVATSLCPLPKGTRFHGVIRYKNLSPEELGLLLWALRLDEGCFQNVGMGKPYGYGRMKVKIERLTEYDPGNLYGGELYSAQMKNSYMNPDEIAAEYIRSYQKQASKDLELKKNQTIRERFEIEDFFYLKRTLQPEKGFSYMPLGSYRNTLEPLPTVYQYRNQAKKDEKSKPCQEEESLSDQGSLEAFVAAFNKKNNSTQDRTPNKKRKGRK